MDDRRFDNLARLGVTRRSRRALGIARSEARNAAVRSAWPTALWSGSSSPEFRARPAEAAPGAPARPRTARSSSAR